MQLQTKFQSENMNERDNLTDRWESNIKMVPEKIQSEE
jgi:hypothetical protein